MTTGTPVIHEDRVYVPISQYEISLGGNDDHECCKSHGAVTALDAKTGKKIWTAHTMEDAKPVRDRGDGKMLWGPSGAPIWNSPAIDAKRGVLYVGTGEATSEPAARNTDAILAIDLKDGALRWTFQATENDIFLSGCGRNRNGLNCPKETVFRDVDFGASVIIAQRSDGNDVLLAGQKPARCGRSIRTRWQGRLASGFRRRLAARRHSLGHRVRRRARVRSDQSSVRLHAAEGGQTQKPGMHAVNVDTGEVLWTFTAQPDCTGDRQSRVKSCANNIGLSAAPTVIDGAVVAGSLDGFLRAFDAKTGQVLFKFDTASTFEPSTAWSERRLDRQRVDHRRQRLSVRELGLRDVRADAGERDACVQGEGRA